MAINLTNARYATAKPASATSALAKKTVPRATGGPQQ
jgi:hypothetical protein